MDDLTAHELRLIAEYEGGDELLRKLMAEHANGVAEWVEQEKDWRREYRKANSALR